MGPIGSVGHHWSGHSSIWWAWGPWLDAQGLGPWRQEIQLVVAFVIQFEDAVLENWRILDAGTHEKFEDLDLGGDVIEPVEGKVNTGRDFDAVL